MLEKILCVDDDPITLMLCKKVIVKANFSKEILFAQNGQEAIELLLQLQKEDKALLPELVFLDLNMPVMNGWDFLNEVCNSSTIKLLNTKVVILSSTIDPSDYEKAKEYNVVSHFLSKPITVELLEKLKNEV
ncbi:MAG: response regulator [Flavobacterium sp.]